MKTHSSVLQFVGSHVGYDSPSQSGYVTLEPPWGVNGIFPNNFKERVSSLDFTPENKLYQVFLNLLIKRFSWSLFAVKLAFNIISPLFKTLCFIAVWDLYNSVIFGRNWPSQTFLLQTSTWKHHDLYHLLPPLSFFF